MSDVERSNLGGAHALAGFLFQALGVSALAARIHAFEPLDSGLTLRLSVTGDCALRHELFGQDAVLEKPGTSHSDGQSRRTFVQFKHSSDPDKNPCPPRELLAIVDAFLKSQRAANKQSKMLADFRLVMNRDLTDRASSLITNAVKRRPDKLLCKGARKRHLVGVIQQLEVIKINSNSLRAHLERFAAERGILEAELDYALHNLIAGVQGSVGGVHPLNGPWLSKKLTGVDDIRPIMPTAVREEMAYALNAFAGNACVPNSLIPREVIGDVEKAIIEKPIVVLHGAGGLGKTVIQYQLLSSRLKYGDCYIAPISARAIDRDNWLAHIVRGWRGGNPELPDDLPERAVHRLARARGNKSLPLLLIDVDGVDEAIAIAQHYTVYMSQILDLACRQYDAITGPKLSIIVSCRELRDLELAWANYRHHNKIIHRIPVTDFSDSELRAAVNTSPLRDELLPLLTISTKNSRVHPGSRARNLNASVKGRGAIPAHILTAIRHPILWGCLMELKERSEVLIGSNVAIQRWAASYVARFVEKATLRHNSLKGLNVEQPLRQIAKGIATTETVATRDAWIEAAQNGYIDSGEAKLIYREALSFGVIKEEELGNWRWTHPFIRDYLADAR